MPEGLLLILVLAAYFIVMRWVLPRFGVST
jgi:hypothetical protein